MTPTDGPKRRGDPGNVAEKEKGEKEGGGNQRAPAESLIKRELKRQKVK